MLSVPAVESLRLPPHCIEAEQAVLGALLLDNGARAQLVGVIEESDFYTAAHHRKIWRAIIKLVEDNQPADVLTVAEALRATGDLADVGGLSYLHQLASSTPSAANIRRYAEIVRERAALRTIAEVAARMQDAALRPGASLSEARRAGEEGMQAIARLQAPGGLPGALPGYAAGSVWQHAAAVPYLCRFVVVRGGLTVLFGMSGHLKSVVAVALAFCVASGMAFFGGFPTTPCGVLYLAGEGFAGLRKRARAWLLEHGFPEVSVAPPVFFTSAGADLFGDPAQVRATIARAEAELGVPIGMVVCDTLTANAGGADLNDARDMGAILSALQRAAPDLAVVVVHHVGHGDPDRERNSSALIAAADVRLQAAYDEAGKVLELRWKKLKDDDAPAPMLLRPKVVRIGGTREDDEPETSIVLEALDGPRPPPVAPRAPGLGKNQQLALKSLRTLLAKARKNLAERGDDPAAACILISGWRHDLEGRGMPAKRFREVFADLQERRLIAVDGPHVAPLEVAE